MRRSVAAGLGATAAVIGGAALAGTKVRDVFRSVGTHREYWQDRAGQPGEQLYIALGDSTAQAVGAIRPQDGYVGRLAADLANETSRTVRVVNLAVSGARVSDLVRDQLPLLAELLAEQPEPALVTVTIGANDTGRTDRAIFEEDMRTVLDALPAGSKVADVPYFRGPRGRDAADFSDVIRELVAERPQLVQVDLWAVTGGMRPREYAADLFHPSAIGYDRYYNAFRNA